MELRSGATRTRQTTADKEIVTKRNASPKKTVKVAKKAVHFTKSPDKKMSPKAAIKKTATPGLRSRKTEPVAVEETEIVVPKTRGRRKILANETEEVKTTRRSTRTEVVPVPEPETEVSKPGRRKSTRQSETKSETPATKRRKVESLSETTEKHEIQKRATRKSAMTTVTKEVEPKKMKIKSTEKDDNTQDITVEAKKPEIPKRSTRSTRAVVEEEIPVAKKEVKSRTVKKPIIEKSEQSTRAEKSEQSTRPEKSEQSTQPEKSEQSTRPEKKRITRKSRSEVEPEIQHVEVKPKRVTRTTKAKTTIESDQREINASGVQVIFNDEKSSEEKHRVENEMPKTKRGTKGRPKKPKTLETAVPEMKESSVTNLTEEPSPHFEQPTDLDVKDETPAAGEASLDSTEENITEDKTIEYEETETGSEQTAQDEPTAVVPPIVVDVVSNLTTQVASMVETESSSHKKRTLEIEEDVTAAKKLRGIRVKNLEIPKIPPIRGQLMTFGDDSCGELGLAQIGFTKTKPIIVPDFPESVVCVAAGAMHTACINSSGQVLTFGCNDECALGRTSSDENEARPTEVPLSVKVTKVTAGDSHTAALTAQGAVYYWGNFRDQNGRIGLTKESTSSVCDPIPIKFEITFVDIASGCNHLLLLSDSGEVYTVGVAEQGALGRLPESECKFEKDLASRFLTPAKIIVSKSEVFDKVWAGNYTSFARTVTGKVYAWGLNNFCQLGFRSNAGEDTSAVEYFPQLLPTFTRSQAKVIKMCGGSHHSLALDADGRVYSCGRFEYGRLGHGEHGSDEESFKPIESLMNEKVVEICCGPVCSFAVTENGQLYSWGMASSNLGVGGDEVDLHSPTQVKAKSLSCVLSVTAGSQHTAIIVSAGGSHNGN